MGLAVIAMVFVTDWKVAMGMLDPGRRHGRLLRRADERAAAASRSSADGRRPLHRGAELQREHQHPGDAGRLRPDDRRRLDINTIIVLFGLLVAGAMYLLWRSTRTIRTREDDRGRGGVSAAEPARTQHSTARAEGCAMTPNTMRTGNIGTRMRSQQLASLMLCGLLARVRTSAPHEADATRRAARASSSFVCACIVASASSSAWPNR